MDEGGLSELPHTNKQFLQFRVFCIFYMFFLSRASLFCGFAVFSLVHFELPVPAQVTAKTWLQNDLLCIEQDIKLSTY